MKTRRRRFAPWPAILLALCCGSCAFWRPPADALTSAQYARLAQRAKPPEELGLQRSGPEAWGPVWIAQGRPERTVLDFSAHRHAAQILPIVQLRVNGRRTQALVDSGAAGGLMDYTCAIGGGATPLRDAGGGIAQLPRMTAQGLAGDYRAYPAIISRLELGGVRMDRVPVAILDDPRGLAGSGWMGGERVEMLLGADFLSRFDRAIFDFPRERLVLENGPETAQTASGTWTAPLLPAQARPTVTAALDGFGAFNMVPDTGADFGLWLPAALAKRIGLAERAAASPLRHARALGGSVYLRDISDHYLRLGDGPPIRVPVTLGPTGDLREQPALLGRAVLERFVVIFDHQNDRFTLLSPR